MPILKQPAQQRRCADRVLEHIAARALDVRLIIVRLVRKRQRIGIRLAAIGHAAAERTHAADHATCNCKRRTRLSGQCLPFAGRILRPGIGRAGGNFHRALIRRRLNDKRTLAIDKDRAIWRKQGKDDGVRACRAGLARCSSIDLAPGDFERGIDWRRYRHQQLALLRPCAAQRGVCRDG